VASLCEQVRQGRVTPPRQVNPRIPRSLERICLKALAADPQQRYASAGAMGRALRSELRRRPILLGGMAAAVLLLGAVLALTLPSWLGGERPAADNVGAVGKAPADRLAGELHVRVWSPEGQQDKQGLEIGKDFGALPVRNKERLRIEVQLNEPAHVYLLWLDSEGVVYPLYPWNEHRIAQRSVSVPPPSQPARTTVRSPADRPDNVAVGWKVAGKSGLDTILLLASRRPLSADVDLAGLIGKAPVTPLRDPLEFAVRGGDEGESVGLVNRGANRGPEAEVEVIDDPLLQLMGRLRGHVEVIRAVRFAHQGRD
jgi:hypothetical protein